jgi:hypothetical protein
MVRAARRPAQEVGSFARWNSTMAISRQPCLAVSVRRHGNCEHTTRKATDRHPDTALTLAKQQLHIHSAPGIPTEAGRQPPHYTIN